MLKCFHTKNSGFPKGKKSIALMLIDLSPLSWGLNSLGKTFKPCLVPWPTSPYEQYKEN